MSLHGSFVGGARAVWSIACALARQARTIARAAWAVFLASIIGRNAWRLVVQVTVALAVAREFTVAVGCVFLLVATVALLIQNEAKARAHQQDAMLRERLAQIDARRVESSVHPESPLGVISRAIGDTHKAIFEGLAGPPKRSGS